MLRSIGKHPPFDSEIKEKSYEIPSKRNCIPSAEASLFFSSGVGLDRWSFRRHRTMEARARATAEIVSACFGKRLSARMAAVGRAESQLQSHGGHIEGVLASGWAETVMEPKSG